MTKSIKELPCGKEYCFWIPVVDNPNCDNCPLNRKVEKISCHSQQEILNKLEEK